MDSSPGDAMDWQKDSPPHIIQPATRPWNRIRTFDEFNDDNQAENPAADRQPTDAFDPSTLPGTAIQPTYPQQPEMLNARFSEQPGELFSDYIQRRANLMRSLRAQESRGVHEILDEQPANLGQNVAIGQQTPRIAQMPWPVRWILIGAVMLFVHSSEFINGICTQTATAAVYVGHTAKRRLVSFTRTTLAPRPQRRRHGSPHPRSSPLFRQNSSSSPGRRSTTPITPPRFRPYRIPGAYPDSPVYITESPFPFTILAPTTPQSSAIPASTPVLAENVLSNTIQNATCRELHTAYQMHDEMEDIIDEDAQQEHTTTHEAQQQGITDKLEEPQPQFTEELEEDSIGPIALQRAPLANSTSSGPHNGQLATLDEQQLQTSGVLPSEIFTGSIGTHRSPFDFSASQGQATVAMGTPEDQVTWISDAPLTETSTGSIEPHRSPLADSMLQVQANGMDSLEGQVTRFENALPVETSSGLIERHRSPLADSRLQVQANEMDTAETQATQVLDALPSETSTGLIDSHRSPLADSQLHRQHTVPVNNVPELTPPKSYLSLMLRRVNPRPQRKGSPLRELFNFANASKVLKTPRKTVNWPKNGPVTATKRFVKHEAIAYPSPASSREDNSILSSIPGDLSPRASPTGQEQDEALQSQCDIYPPLYPNTNWTVLSASTNENNGLPLVSATERTRTVNVASDERNNSPSSSSDDDHSDNSVETPVKASSNVDQTTPSSRLSPLLADLNVSTRRVSLRRREKDLEEERKRAKEEAFAAAEKARKEKEEAEGKARKKKEEAEEKARKEKAEAEEKARRDADEEAERKKVGARRIPIEKVIQPLTEEWEEKVRANMAKGMSEQLAMTSVGNPLSRRDFGKVLPQRGTGDDPSGWLNDEIISAYLQAVVDHSHAVLGHKRGDPPKVHAFNPFFYKNLAKQGGYDNVKRWGRRAKFGDVSQMEWIFVPVNTGVHWTLIAVSPIRKTIEFFDSLHHHSRNEIRIIKLWLKGELGHSFVEEEWTVVEDPAFPNKGKGPTQDNAKDCGVFTVTTAKMLSLGVDPMAVSADDMPLQRRRIVAELLNGGFSGSFEPRIAFD